MKNALVILHADPRRGGAERYTLDLAVALAERGHDVSLLAGTFADIPPQIKKVPLAADGFTRKRQYLSMLDSLDRHLDRTRYEIVHAMLPVHRCDLYHPHAGLAVLALKQGPITAALNPRRTAMGRIEQQLLSSSHPPRVLCLSEYVKRLFKQHYPLNEAHLPILFNGVDTIRFDPAGQSKPANEKVIALMIAQDFERKGLREAIMALSQVTDQRLILRVVGKQDVGKYERLAERTGIAGRVQFAGPTTDPAREYAGADFFVLPTKHDPCSLVVLESLAMGLPVISTQFNGACEIMATGTHGFVLSNPVNIASLAEAMRKMLDSELRARMSAACLELRPRLSYQHHLDQLLHIYEQSVQSDRPR